MTGALTDSTTSDRSGPSGQPGQARLELKPAGTGAGYVDGAWWPHSTNLTIETPSLVADLGVRLAQVDRVSYDLSAWDSTDRRLTTGGIRIRMDGFRGRRPAGTVNISDVLGNVLTILVIPPATTPESAQLRMTRASTRGNTETPAELLS